MSPTLRVGFAGTPEFAAVALQSILDAGFTVPLVLTQPDRPAGRGLKLTPSAVKELALTHSLPLAQPKSLRLDGKFSGDAMLAKVALEDAQLDVLVVAAYGLILPQWTLDTPRLGCLNIHGSLLPRWRGAAPIHRAIEAGDTQAGITIMQMDAGLDTGDMLDVEAIDISSADTTASLHDRLAALGALMLVRCLHSAALGQLKPVPQPAVGVTYAHKIEKSEALIDWRRPAAEIERRVRAFTPFPGTSSVLDGETIKIHDCYIIDSNKVPQILDKGHIYPGNDAELIVQTGLGLLAVTQVQRAGGKRISVADFLRTKPLAPLAHFQLAE